MTSSEQILLAMYQEHVTQARQHEDQREKLTNLLLVIAAAFLAFTAESTWQPRHLILTTALIVLGLFGALFSYKHYERNRRHVRIAKGFRDELEDVSGVKITSIRAAGAQEHDDEYEHASRLRLFAFWLAIPLGIALLGAVLTYHIACQVR